MELFEFENLPKRRDFQKLDAVGYIVNIENGIPVHVCDIIGIYGRWMVTHYGRVLTCRNQLLIENTKPGRLVVIPYDCYDEAQIEDFDKEFWAPTSECESTVIRNDYYDYRKAVSHAKYAYNLRLLFDKEKDIQWYIGCPNLYKFNTALSEGNYEDFEKLMTNEAPDWLIDYYNKVKEYNTLPESTTD